MSEDKQNEKKENGEKKCSGMNCDFLKKHLDYVIGGAIIVALVVALVFVIVKDDKSTVSEEQESTEREITGEKVSEKVFKKVEDRLEGVFGEQVQEVSIDEVREERNLYKIYMTFGSQEAEFYLTKDYEVLITEFLDIDDYLEKIKEEKEKSSKLFENTASDLGINIDEFNSCLEKGQFAEKVDKSVKEGQSAGVTGTPHNVVIINGVQYDLPGAQPIENIKKVLDTALAGGFITLDKSAKNVKVVDVNDHVRGNLNSNIVFVEYSDVDCPYCKRHHETIEKLVEEYSNRVQFVFRPFPIDSLHPKAREKSEATECANDLGGEDVYWKYLDAMFKSK